MTKLDEQELMQSARQVLDRSADELDSFTVARLKLARQQALEATPRRRLPLVPATVFSAAVVGLLAVSLLWQGESLRFDEQAPADVELLSTIEELDLYEDMEFYEWLPAGVDHAG